MPRLGVLGWPVAHSRSPQMHNAALEAAGLGDWRYQLLPVPPALFAETARALGAAGFVGANVTIPHKQAALRIADSASRAAREIGAANTLSFSADGAIAAENTDAPGLLDALPVDPAGRRALVLGAGGSARAAAWALSRRGADVSVWNRTPARARELARELGVRAVKAPFPSEILVNCTSVGLAHASSDQAALKQLELSIDALRDYEIVADLVYEPPTTPLLRAARRHGAQVVGGVEILVAQGALSFQIWTGRQAPLEVMRSAASHDSPRRG